MSALPGTLEQYITSSLHSDGFISMTKAGGGVLLLGLLLGLLIEWAKFYQGQPANWMDPVIKVLFIAALIGLYPFIIQLVTSFIASFGDLADGSQKAGAVFHARQVKMLELLQSDGDGGFLSSINLNNMKIWFIKFLTLILSWITMGLIEALKFIQALVLRVLIFLGPVMFACGALPGPFRQFPMNWIMLFFSISFWSVVMSAMLSMLASMTSQTVSGGELGFIEEIINSLTWIMVILSVPALSASLVYGGGFTSALSEVAGVATGGATSAAVIGNTAANAGSKGASVLGAIASKFGGKSK